MSSTRPALIPAALRLVAATLRRRPLALLLPTLVTAAAFLWETRVGDDPDRPLLSLALAFLHMAVAVLPGIAMVRAAWPAQCAPLARSTGPLAALVALHVAMSLLMLQLPTVGPLDVSLSQAVGWTVVAWAVAVHLAWTRWFTPTAASLALGQRGLSPREGGRLMRGHTARLWGALLLTMLVFVLVGKLGMLFVPLREAAPLERLLAQGWEALADAAVILLLNALSVVALHRADPARFPAPAP